MRGLTKEESQKYMEQLDSRSTVIQQDFSELHDLQKKAIRQYLRDMYGVIGNALRDGNFNGVDLILMTLDPARMSAEVMCGYLTKTFAYSGSLKEYPRFFEAVINELRGRLGPERAKKILAGLEGYST